MCTQHLSHMDATHFTPIKNAPVPVFDCSRAETIRPCTMSHLLSLDSFITASGTRYWCVRQFFLQQWSMVSPRWLHKCRNYHIWSRENQHEYRESGLHPQKIGVWWVISRRRIIGPILFETMVNPPFITPFWDHSWSQDGLNHHLLARRSKQLNLNFRPWGSQNGWNFQERYFRDHWRHVPEQNSVSRAKMWKFDPFCRTSKWDPRFWSHAGQKDRIKIFGRGAAKMGEISTRDTFETTGVMFLSKILSPGQKCGNLTHFVAPQNVIPGSGARQSKRPIRNFGNGWNFQEGYFRDHWRHVPERNSLSRAKISA